MNPIPNGALQPESPFMANAAVDVVVFPSNIDLAACITANLVTGAQCGHAEPNGAHTGDVSMQMLKDTGCTYVLCGHSERRLYHKETNEDVAAQTQAAVVAGLQPIVCVGETAEEREVGQAEEVVAEQIEAVLQGSTCNVQPATLTFAYEPVWAIGTGNTASPEQAQKMHAFIRQKLSAFQAEFSEFRILYGGSMKPENAAALLGQPDINGGLIGGASLQCGSFAKIVNIALKVAI